MNHNTETSAIRYFDLRLDRSERGVTATVTNSPAGQSSSPWLSACQPSRLSRSLAN